MPQTMVIELLKHFIFIDFSHVDQFTQVLVCAFPRPPFASFNSGGSLLAKFIHLSLFSFF